MHLQITAQLRRRGDLLLAGRIDELLVAHHYPLPIYLPKARLLLQGPDVARSVFSVLRRALVDSGIVALCPQVRAVELPRAGRFRVWVDWQELALPGGENRSSSAIYYCRAAATGALTEMIDFTHLSMPGLNRQFQALALSA